MKRLFLFIIILLASIQVEAAKMSSYTNNTTPNADVYFIGVDPNDTTQTANGSNYRYSLSSILGSGLLDFNVNSLTVSGTGDSWLELENNTSFTDSLVGKYGIRFYNGVLQQILNGTATNIGSTSIQELASDPTYADLDTGEMAVSTASGDLFIKTATGLYTIAGTYAADPTTPTLTSLTIPTSGDTATAVFSEAMTIGAGGSGGWTLNDPTDAMTYASGDGTDTIVFNLASTILSTDTPTVSYTQPTDGFESNDDNTDLVSISGASVTNNSTQTMSLLIAALDCYQNNGEALDTGGVNVTAANITHGTGHDSVANASVVINSDGDNYYFPANQTNGLLDPTKGTIEFWYKHNVDISKGTMFAQDSAISAFRIERNLLANQFYLTITNETVALNVSSTLWNGSWHKVRLTWDDAANVRTLYMDDTQQSTSTATWTSGAITTGNMWIGNRSGLYATNAEFQDFKIYSEAIAP